MFQFRRFPTYAYLIQRRLTEYCSAGFPHSVILGSTPMCGSPRLIAACHVLLRLLMPRHSPCALSSLTSSPQAPYPSLPSTDESSLISLRLLSELKPPVLIRLFKAGFSNYAGFRVLRLLLCYPSLKLHNLLPSLLLALYIWNFFLHCSVFKVQSLVSFETRYKHSIL